MPDYLLCANPSCRLIIDLEGCRKPIRLSEIGIDNCPECSSAWSSTCPFCAHRIDVVWHGHHAHCANCHRRFYARAA